MYIYVCIYIYIEYCIYKSDKIKMINKLSKYYQKKEALERYQNLSEEEKEKKLCI